ncbi:MAG: ATP-binding protein [Acidimicrobiales bacterium]
MSGAIGQDTLVERDPRVGILTNADHQAVHHMTPATACGRDARRFVRERLDAWGWPRVAHVRSPASGRPASESLDAGDSQAAQDLQDILLLTSELAINAAEHARSPMDVTVRYWPGNRVRIEVHDEGEGIPVARWPTSFEESGRGLALVDMLSESWGVTDCPIGKTVWFEFRLH